jgi:H+/Cl- antiporter ClcA
MLKSLKEEETIFINIVRWIVLATLIGVVAGVLSALFLKSIEWGSNLAFHSPWYFWMLPLVFFINLLLVNYLGRESLGKGTELVIEAIQKRSGKMKASIIPVKFITTVMTLAAGGSAGKEGPAAQMSAALASMASDVFKLRDADRKKLVICAFSAGFASIFGTPVSGAIFGIEVLFVGLLLYDVLLPSFMAGIAAYHTTRFFGIEHFQHRLDFSSVIDHQWFILEAIGSGLFFGLVVLLITVTIKGVELAEKKIKIWQPAKGLIGGTAIALSAMLIGTETLGLGSEVILAVLSGTSVLWYVFLLKILLTAITLNFGGSGGVISPLLFIGAASGAWLGHLFGADPAIFAAIGFISVLGGAANVPIAMSIMAVELFEVELAPYAALACIVSYLISGHRSVYPAQILASEKTAHIQEGMEKSMEKLDNEYEQKKAAAQEHKSDR